MERPGARRMLCLAEGEDRLDARGAIGQDNASDEAKGQQEHGDADYREGTP